MCVLILDHNPRMTIQGTVSTNLSFCLFLLEKVLHKLSRRSFNVVIPVILSASR